MGRRKRSEKRISPVVERPSMVSTSPKATGRNVGALCPVCGRLIQDRAIKARYATLGKVPYFESIEWDPRKPFGVALPAGRGAFADWSYINPSDAPELFQAVRKRLLEAIREWCLKDWIGEEELDKIGGNAAATKNLQATEGESSEGHFG